MILKIKLSSLSKKRAIELASNLNLQVDKTTGIVFGKKQGYDICIKVNNNYKAFISISVLHNDKFLSEDEFNQFVKTNKIISAHSIFAHAVVFVINPAVTKGKCIIKIQEAVNLIVNHLWANNYENCFEFCGEKQDISSYIVSGEEVISCSKCFGEQTVGREREFQQENTKIENHVSGIVGSILGSVLGAVSIIIFGQLGYISSVSGILMGVLSAKGYELFAKKLSKFGIIISAVIALVMIYLGCRLDWAVTIVRAVSEVDIFTAFSVVPEIFQQDFISNLVKLYIFVIIPIIVFVINEFRSKKSLTISHKLEA